MTSGFVHGRLRFGLFLSLVLSATTSSTVLAAGEYDPASNTEAKSLVDMLVSRGYDRERLNDAMRSATHQQSIIDAMSRPAERRLRWDEYRDLFMQPARVQAGVQFIKDNAQAMQRAEQQYGVPREIIAAIIGVETFYGRNTGKYRVIDALSTLAFDYPSRAKFFRGELEAYLAMTLSQHLDPLSFKGSYAGAMGYPQFMPTSYRAYAVDFNNDGVKDLWREPADVIGSVANYFARHHWQQGGPITVEAKGEGAPPASIAFNDVTAPPSVTVAELKKADIQPVDGTALPSDTRVIPLALNFADGHYRYVLGLDNFYVITRYNHSHLYAMAVTTLAERIKEALAQES